MPGRQSQQDKLKAAKQGLIASQGKSTILTGAGLVVGGIGGSMLGANVGEIIGGSAGKVMGTMLGGSIVPMLTAATNP